MLKNKKQKLFDKLKIKYIKCNFCHKPISYNENEKYSQIIELQKHSCKKLNEFKKLEDKFEKVRKYKMQYE